MNMQVTLDGYKLESKCGSCGKELSIEDLLDHPLAIIFDPGEINYPREPDIPATAWLECWECSTNNYVEVDDVLERAEDMGWRCHE